MADTLLPCGTCVLSGNPCLLVYVRVKLGSEISCKNDRHSSVKFSEVVVMVTSVAIVSCGCCFLFLLLFTCV